MDSSQLLALIFNFDQQIGAALEHYGTGIYLLLSAIIYLEISFLPLFFLPGNPMLFIAGALCASGSMQIGVLIPVLAIATILASVTGYGLGYVIGDRAYQQNYRWLNQAALRRAHAFYESKGRYTFLLTPFIAVIRTFAPFAAGVAQMTFSKYLVSMAAGAILWPVSLVVAGYYFGNVPLVKAHMATLVVAGIALGLGSLAVVTMWKYWQAHHR